VIVMEIYTGIKCWCTYWCIALFSV